MNLFLIFFFLCQFPGIIPIGSSYVGAFVLTIPFVAQSRIFIKSFIPILIILVISSIYGFINHGSLSIIELGQRILSYSIIVYILLWFKFYIGREKNQGTSILVQRLLILSIPSLIFNLFELIYKITNISVLYNLIYFIKSIFIPFRARYTIGTIYAFFPEHGLFPPFLHMMMGISLLYLYLSYAEKGVIRYKTISVIWLLLGLFHVSGLHYFTLIITLSIVMIGVALNFIINLKVSKKLIKYSFLLIVLVPIIVRILFLINLELFNRYEILINIIPKIAENPEILSIDRSFYYKLLPYKLLSILPTDTLILGSGISHYSNAVTENMNRLPQELTNNIYFYGNLINERFSLNSLLICQFIELGIVGSIIIFLLLPKPIKIKMSDLLPFPGYKYIIRKHSSKKPIALIFLSIFFFLSSFLTILGAVPLLYPYPWISLSFIFLIIDAKRSNDDIKALI